MKIAISSNNRFYKKTIPVCVKSLIESGFDPNDIYVFVGGYDGDYETMDVGFGVNAYKCPHNSFDFTSVVSIIDLDILDHKWFMLHDTVEVDPNFKDLIESHTKDSGRRVNRSQSMSMGSYDKRSFDLAIEKLDQIRNISKGECVRMEDYFIKHMPHICNGFKDLGCEDVYGGGVSRFIEYYKAAGIKKNKANNKIRSDWITNL